MASSFVTRISGSPSIGAAADRPPDLATYPRPPDLLTLQEAAACLRLSVSTLRRWCLTGVLPYVRVGTFPSGRLRIPREAIEAIARGEGVRDA